MHRSGRQKTPVRKANRHLDRKRRTAYSEHLTAKPVTRNIMHELGKTLQRHER